MQYVALLRGINVGGANIISMTNLKKCFEQAGYENVRSYINSGNIIFNSKHAEADAPKIAAHLEQCIKKSTGLIIRVIVRSHKQILAITKKIPTKWMNDAEMRTEVFFLWPEVDRPSVLKEIKTNPDVDNLIYTKGAVIWNILRKDYTKTGLRKFIGTYVYKNMTGRNVNTTRKLSQLMSE